MLYIGNFSYTDTEDEHENNCLMPCLVEAPNPDAALVKFTDLLYGLHDSVGVLAGAKRVYLDSLVELSEIPNRAMVIQWQKVVSADDGMYSVVNPLPMKEDFAESFVWGHDSGVDNDADDDFDDEPEDYEDDEFEDDEFEGDDVDEDGELDGDDVISADELAEALTAALEMLTSDDLAAVEDEGLDDEEDAFVIF